jgi:hypothetical protein
MPLPLNGQVRFQHAVAVGASDLPGGGWGVGSRHRVRGFLLELGTMVTWEGLGGLAYVAFPSPFPEPSAKVQADAKMFVAIGLGRRFGSPARPEYGWGQWVRLLGFRYWPLGDTGGFFEFALGGFRTLGVSPPDHSIGGLAGHIMAGFAF